MTNAEFEALKKLLEDYPNKKEVLNFIKLKDKCLGCEWNDNYPHSACYNCD